SVPIGKGREGDAVARGVDQPAVSEVHRDVVDLRRLGPRAAVTEEEEVGRLDARRLDAPAAWNFAGHRRGGAAAEDIRKLRRARIRLDLVYAPGEARAVEAAARLRAEGRVRRLALAAPHVWEADEADRSREHASLPWRQGRKREGRRRV